MQGWCALDFRGANKVKVEWDEEEVVDNKDVTIVEDLGIMPMIVQIRRDHHAYIVPSLITRQRTVPL